jgi:Ca2+-binding EF-hand superfamily protein
MFDQKQMQEFKEAFGLMDQDRDGSISLDDLKEVYSSLGKSPKEGDLKQMLEETGGPVNFTKLIQLFGDRLHGLLENSMKLFHRNFLFLSRDGCRRYFNECF